jgi:hypothetical protein
VPFGVFRRHEAQKTQLHREQTDSSLNAAAALIARSTLSPELKRELLTDLDLYRQEYPAVVWRYSGRLARLGLPPSIVNPLRGLKRTMGRTLASLGGAISRLGSKSPNVP